MEHGRMGGIRCITSEASSRRNHLDGWLLTLYGSNLYRRGLGSKQCVFRNVKSVGQIPGRMIFRRIQCVKVIEYGINLGAFRHRKTHGHENSGNFIDGNGNQMLGPQLFRFPRLSHIDFFLSEFLFLRFGFYFRQLPLQCGLNLFPNSIGFQPQFLSLLRRKFSHRPQNFR